MSTIRIKPMQELGDEDALVLQQLTLLYPAEPVVSAEQLRAALSNLYYELLALKQRAMQISEPPVKYDEQKAQRFWSPADHARFVELLAQNMDFYQISEALGTKSVWQVRSHHYKFVLKLKVGVQELGPMPGFRKHDGIYYAFAAAIARRMGVAVALCDRVIFDGGSSVEKRVRRRDCFSEDSEQVLYARKLDVAYFIADADVFAKQIFALIEKFFATGEPAGNWAHACSYALQRSFKECEEMIGAILVYCSYF